MPFATQNLLGLSAHGNITVACQEKNPYPLTKKPIGSPESERQNWTPRCQPWCGTYLKSLAGTASGSGDAEKETERRRELMRQVFQDFEARGVGLRMSENLTREELYDRTRARPKLRQRPPKTKTATWVSAMRFVDTN